MLQSALLSTVVIPVLVWLWVI